MSKIKIIDDQNLEIEPVNQTLCEICQKQFSNYVCPRCNLRYCSLVCYKDLQHAECTESFYKDSVTAEIQSRDLDVNDKKKMLAMLKRLEDEQQDEQAFLEDDEDEDDDTNELLERFSNIDLDNTDPDLIWNLLSDKERKEFESVLNEIQTTGQWGKLDIPTYEPWWGNHQHTLIFEQDQPPIESAMPSMPKSVPDLTSMLKPESRTSPHLAWNLLHILALYSYLMRQSLGNLDEDPENTIQQCKDLSVYVLFSSVADCPYRGVQDVIVDLVERILQLENKTLSNNNTRRRFDLQLLLLQDVDLLLSESVRAVHDLWTVMYQQKKKKSVILATRKLYFYLAVAGYMDTQRRDTLHAAIQSELIRVKAEKEEFQQGFDAAQDAIEAFKKQQQKIQEL